MRAHSLLWIAMLTLTACATFNKTAELLRQDEFRLEFTDGTLCTTTDCTVTLTVAAGCVVTIDPPSLGVDRTVTDATIHWMIQPNSAGRVEFARAGINPKQPGWRLEFRDPKRVSATEFTWLDKNRLDGGPHKRPHPYDIDMLQDGARCHVDPSIINDY